MTGLLHEGTFHVGGLIKPAIFDSLPWAYVMCNWAQILIGDRALIWYWDHLKNFFAEIPQGPLGMSIGTIWVT